MKPKLHLLSWKVEVWKREEEAEYAAEEQKTMGKRGRRAVSCLEEMG